MPTRNQISGKFRVLRAYKKIEDRSSQNLEIRHVILTLIDSGLALFHQTFSNEIIDPNLFSALVTAISLGRRVNNDSEEECKNETFEVDRHNANICYGKYLAGIAISDTPLDSKLMTRLKKFIKAFEIEYEFLLVNWHGDISFFDQEWASTMLSQYLYPSELMYRLHTDAMNRSDNGRQIRGILLIRRFVGKSDFELSSLQRLIMKELQVPEGDADEFLTNLEVQGIIIPTASPA